MTACFRALLGLYWIRNWWFHGKMLGVSGERVGKVERLFMFVPFIIKLAEFVEMFVGFKIHLGFK